VFLLCNQRCTHSDGLECDIVEIVSYEGFDKCPNCDAPMEDVQRTISCQNCGSRNNISQYMEIRLCDKCSDALKGVRNDE